MRRRLTWLLLFPMLLPSLARADVQIKSGATTDTLTVQPSSKAARIEARPLDTTLGHYRLSVVTGTLAATLAAGAQVYQFKNPTTNLAIVTKIRTRFLPLTIFTAATLTDHTSFDVVVVRSYAAGGGGTTLTLTGHNAKMRTSMATPGVVINVATTAALTAATTLDAQPLAQSLRRGSNTVTATEQPPMPDGDGATFAPDLAAGESPLILALNEGFVIRNRTVWPAAGTGVLLIEVAWAEAVSY
jgi:hypothetical protein